MADAPDLLESVYLGDLDAVRAHLDADAAAVNATSPDGFTALHVAVQQGHLDVVELLFERGALPNQRNRAGLTPMFMLPGCPRRKQVRMMELLTAGGATLKAKADNGLNVEEMIRELKLVEVMVWLDKRASGDT